MKIIDNSADVKIFDLYQHDDIYYRDVNVFARAYLDSVVIIDLTNAMRNGRNCTRWHFSASSWHMDTSRLCITEYMEMAAPECDTLPELVEWLRAGKPMTEVDGLEFRTDEQAGNRTFSPFASIKPVKLGERLTAATIAKAILSGQIAAGVTEGRYTDDYAADAAYDFYRGEIDLKAFALDIYEHPQGWRFWWNNENRTDIVAACHTFDYKRLAVAV